MNRYQVYRAINFDLCIDDLKRKYSRSNPKYAYTEIKNYMESHGFEHRQYSGYKSMEPMSDIEVTLFFDKLFQRFGWLPQCAAKIDVTEIGKEYDMLDYWNRNVLNIKGQGKTSIPFNNLNTYQQNQATPPKHIR